MFQIARPTTTSAVRSRSGFVAGVLAALMLASVPAAQAGSYNDLRSPDARDQAQAGSSIDLRSPDARDQTQAGSSIDLRSPDARDARHVGAQLATPPVDLRSPDARDARHVGAHFASPAGSTSFDAGDAALIAGGAIVLALIVLGSWMLVGRPSRQVRNAGGPAVSG